MYLIESMEHSQGVVKSWWMPDECGYTTYINKAGRYSFAKADSICAKAGSENERMWLESDVLEGKAGIVATVVMS